MIIRQLWKGLLAGVIGKGNGKKIYKDRLAFVNVASSSWDKILTGESMRKGLPNIKNLNHKHEAVGNKAQRVDNDVIRHWKENPTSRQMDRHPQLTVRGGRTGNISPRSGRADTQAWHSDSLFKGASVDWLLCQIIPKYILLILLLRLLHMCYYPSYARRILKLDLPPSPDW